MNSMSNRDKINTLLCIALGLILVVLGMKNNYPAMMAGGACLAALMPFYYCFWKNREEEECAEEAPFPDTREEFEELLMVLTERQEWIAQELTKRPVILDYQGYHRVLETQADYRDALGWVRENIRQLS